MEGPKPRRTELEAANKFAEEMAPVIEGWCQAIALGCGQRFSRQTIEATIREDIVVGSYTLDDARVALEITPSCTLAPWKLATYIPKAAQDARRRIWMDLVADVNNRLIKAPVFAVPTKDQKRTNYWEVKCASMRDWTIALQERIPLEPGTCNLEKDFAGRRRIISTMLEVPDWHFGPNPYEYPLPERKT